MMTSEAPLVRQRPHGILIADDEAEVRDVLHDKLRQEGFSVWLAADGQEAVDLYRTHRETIDVALLDVCMPGLDGPRTLVALQQLTPQIRCCFMSGYLGNHIEKDLCGVGAARVFAKPFRLDEVANVLRQLACCGNVNLGRQRPCSDADRAERPSAIAQGPIINMVPKVRMSAPWEAKLGRRKPMEQINTLNSLYARRGIDADGVDPQEPVVVTRSQPASTRVGEHPLAVHTALPGDLWMVDHNGATVLRCRCLAVSATQMRLCVPAGYGVAVGQRYELSARDPGEQLFPSLRAIVTRWVTVMRTLEHDRTRIRADRRSRRR